MPRVRLTVRELMIAVAIVGAGLGILAERRARFLRIAARHEEAARPFPLYTGYFVPLETWWHAELQAKYERAARSPWLPVGADPPCPKAIRPKWAGGLPAIPDEPPPWLTVAPAPPPK